MRVVRPAQLVLFQTVLLLTAGRISAQTPPPAGEGAPPTTETTAGFTHAAPSARAIRTATAVRIDGVLDENVWTSADPATRFTQLDPAEGEPSSEATEVRVAYDESAIYIGAILHDASPVTTRLARRDGDLSNSDYFEVVLDSYHDHQTAYRFTVNPSGVRQDAVISGGHGLKYGLSSNVTLNGRAPWRGFSTRTPRFWESVASLKRQKRQGGT